MGRVPDASMIPINLTIIQRAAEILLAHKPPEDYALIWTAPSRISRWYQTVPELRTGIEHEPDATLDWYLGCGWGAADLGKNKRAKAHEITGIPGLWADIDVRGGAHKKPNLPPDIPTALAAIHEIALPPSLIIHSGWGLHLWWLFDDGWIFDDTDDRHRASKLSIDWQAYLRAQFDTRGWDLDATADLSRILRLPGTVNHKLADQPQLATILGNPEDEIATYEPEDLRQWLNRHGDESPPTRNGVVSHSPTAHTAATFTINPNAEPPAAKWEALRETDPKVVKSWNHTRKDMQDQSPSAYDQSLANFAAAVGWPDQEIVDLLVAHRRLHGETSKFERVDYFERTIARARAVNASAMSEEVRVLIQPTVASDDPEPEMTDDGRATLLNFLCDSLGMPTGSIKRITQYQTDPEVWYLDVLDQHRPLGKARDVLSQQTWIDLKANVFKLPLKRLKPPEWITITSAILKAAVAEDVGPEGRDLGATWSALHVYLQAHRALEDRDSALTTDEPFIDDGATHIILESWHTWLQTNQYVRKSKKELAVLLRGIGAYHVVKGYFVQGTRQRTTKYTWRLPEYPYADEDRVPDACVEAI